jgi:hypothetical protein
MKTKHISQWWLLSMLAEAVRRALQQHLQHSWRHQSQVGSRIVWGWWNLH